MNVNGKITIFVEKKEGKNGNSFQIYRGSISHKCADGQYVNANIELEFDSKFPHNDKLPQLKENTAYQLDVKEGWLDSKCWEYENQKQYRIVIHVKDATIVSAKEVSKSTNNGQLF